MHHRFRRLAILLLPVALLPAAILALPGCDASKLLGALVTGGAAGKPGIAVVDRGVVSVHIETLPAYSVQEQLADIAKLKVVLKQENKPDQVLEIAKDKIIAGKATATFDNVPLGFVVVEVTAFDGAGKLIGSAQATGKVEPAATTSLALKLELVDVVVEIGKTPPPGSVEAVVTVVDGFSVSIENIALPAAPSYVAADPTGGWWVSAAAAKKVFKVGPYGEIKSTFDSSWAPGAVAVNASGSAFVIGAGNPNILKFPAGGQVVSYEGATASAIVAASDGTLWTLAGTEVRHMDDFCDPIGNPVFVGTANGLAIGPSGAVIVASADNQKITKISPEGDVSQLGFAGNPPVQPAVTSTSNLLFGTINNGRFLVRTDLNGIILSKLDIPEDMTDQIRGVAANQAGWALAVGSTGVAMFSTSNLLWSHPTTWLLDGAGADSQGNVFFWGSSGDEGRLALVKIKNAQ